jgi:RNA polymerase sigma factor (sigma-70 family)
LTVYVVDDDPAVCAGLSALVRSMDLLVETFTSPQEFLEHCDQAQPGCLLLDVRMPGTNGLDLFEKLVESDHHMPVIVISAYGDVPMVVRAMKAGAVNFLEKPCRDQQLWDAIQEALSWDAENRRQIARRNRFRKRLSDLTDGEREVLEAILAGMSNRAIASQLGFSVRTIEVRRSKVMKKMRAGSLAELIRFALAAEWSFR